MTYELQVYLINLSSLYPLLPLFEKLEPLNKRRFLGNVIDAPSTFTASMNRCKTSNFTVGMDSIRSSDEVRDFSHYKNLKSR